MRRAKIVCTIGPASSKPEVLRAMIEAGMDVARLNFSHGAHSDHRANYDMIRGLSQELGKPIAILQDLQGPKIRVGKFAEGQIPLEPGAQLIITTDDIIGDVHRVSTTYKNLPQDVNPGDALLLDDGLLRLRVREVTETDVVTEVEIGGTLKNSKGINLPGVAISAPSMTERDKRDLAFGLELGVDYVALSFVRSALDIHMLRAMTAKSASPPGLIAKIEKPEAVEDLDSIIAVSDGIMVARGDLGVELPPEQVPLFQKRALAEASRDGCLTITATQMLDSMTYNPRPTRAEASDVANAILDGSDAVMLSGETAAGKYPVETIKMMARIIQEVEQSERYAELRASMPSRHLKTFPNTIARAATVSAETLDIKAITVFTESGNTARLLMSYRPSKQIIACTTSSAVLNKLQLFWGVTPALIEPKDTIDDMVQAVEDLVRHKELAGPGDELIILLGTPIGEHAETNLLKLHRVAGFPGLGAFPASRW